MTSPVTISPTPELVAEASRHPRKPSFLARVLNAAMAARQRQADREIAELVARRGGIMTDELERQLARASYRSHSFHAPKASRPE